MTNQSLYVQSKKKNFNNTYPNADERAFVAANGLRAAMDSVVDLPHPKVYHHRPVDCHAWRGASVNDEAAVPYDPNAKELSNC